MPPPQVISTRSASVGPYQQQREQSAHRVDLEVAEAGGDLDFFYGERLEQFERTRVRRARTTAEPVRAST